MKFTIFLIFIQVFVASLYAQNLSSSWALEMHSKRNVDVSARNGTADNMDSLNEYEWLYQNYVSSSLIYPDKLDLLLKSGLSYL